MEENWEFAIPLQKEDLLKDISGQYHVAQVLPLEKALKTSKVAVAEIRTKSCSIIFDYFDSLYSVVSNSNATSLQLQELYDSYFDKLFSELRNYAENSISLDDPRAKKRALNAIKMNIYAFHLFFKTYEDRLSQSADSLIPESKIAKKKIKSKSKSEENWDWITYKKEAFRIILSVVSLNMGVLWPNLVAEEPFVNLIANTCYKAFENQEITQAKNRAIKDTICQILGVLVSQYNHGLTFISRAVELMKKNENTVSSISTCVIIMVREHKCTSVFPRLLEEFYDILLVEDVAGLSKSVSILITDIAELYPELVYPCISTLKKYLMVEPYAARNAALIAFCEILLKCFKGELNEEENECREKLLNCLFNHFTDQNAYVRSKDLQLWKKLAAENAIPKDMITKVTKVALNRINDKSAFVVKSAVQFFCVLLKQNPFAGKLKISQLEKELLQAMATLEVINVKRTLSREESWKKIEPELVLAITKKLEEGEVEVEQSASDSVNVQDVVVIITKLLQEKHYNEAYTCLRLSEAQFPNAKELRCNLDIEDKVEYYANVMKKLFMGVDVDSMNLQVEFDCYSDEYEKQSKIVKYVEEATAFAKLMCSVCDEVSKIMKGKSLLEVLEAIEFFTTAYQFGLPNAPAVIREILIYVKCKQPGVKEAVVAAYKTLYLTTGQPTPRGKAVQIAQRLIKLVRELDSEQKYALEELIQEWVSSKELANEFIQVLWEKYSKKSQETTEEESIAALILLNMIAGSTPALISSNISILLDVGLTTNAPLKCVTETCNILARLGSTKIDGKYIRYPRNHPIFEKSSSFLIEQFSKPHQKGFLQLAMAVVRMIFRLACSPEKISDQILTACFKIISPKNEIDGGSSLNTSQQSKSSVSSEETASELLLARLFHIHSEIIFRKWIYFDRDVANNLKRSEVVESIKKKKPVEIDEMDEFESDNREAEEDALINSIAELCERLVTDDSTFNSRIREAIINVCRGRIESKTISLQTAAATSLAKLMTVSHKFCENNVQLYMTLMERSKSEEVRSHLIFGIGDLICRFPNVIEPWTPHIYSRLKDESVMVRKNSVLVLSHLITREMIKVRGQIAEVCLCLEDKEPTIVAQVQSLLMDLSQKGNSLYNIVVDIISRLSNPDRPDPVTSEAFNRIMKFTLALLGKERQNELLVEKLCLRIKEATVERQWRDLSFCLSQLSFNEKSLKRLTESLPTLNERLFCHEVQSAINSVISAALKSINKPQLKEAAHECQAKLEELLKVKKDETIVDETNSKSRRRSSEDNENVHTEEMCQGDKQNLFKTPQRPPPEAKPSRSRTRRRQL